jgi:hypothetical protein
MSNNRKLFSHDERQKEERILGDKIKQIGLWASDKDKEMLYSKEDSLLKGDDIDFVISKFKFIKDESAFVPILKKLSEKYKMNYYDTAFWMFCAFRGMQDSFELLSSIRFLGHFYPKFHELYYMKIEKVAKEVYCRWESVNKTINKEHIKDYFYESKFLKILGINILKYFHEINRFKKMGMQKKVAPNNQKILNLFKNRYFDGLYKD